MPPETPTKPKATKPRSAPKPPNRVSPGWIHRALAVNILKGMQARATESGISLDVGELPSTDTLARDAGIVDDRQPVELLSRILAHLFHRTPGLKRVERRFEGKDSSSGIMSDLAAFITQIYTRNESSINSIKDSAVEQAKQSRKAKDTVSQ